MIKTRPHIITYTIPGTPDGWNEDEGLPIPGTPDEEVTVPCRYQENSRENYTVKGDDGNRIVFDGIVYLDKDTSPVAFGQEVSITKDGNPLAKGTVKRFHPGQMHNRIWI